VRTLSFTSKADNTAISNRPFFQFSLRQYIRISILIIFLIDHHIEKCSFLLAYGWSAGNLNRPIRIQQAEKILVSWCKVDKSGEALKSGTFLTGDGVGYPRKGIFNFKNHTSWQRLKSVNHFVFLNFYFGPKNARHGNSIVVRRVSQGRIIIVLFWTKHAVPPQFKPGKLKLTTSRGKRNLLTVFIFVSFEQKGCYRIVSLGHQNFDCRSYCGLSSRMQGWRTTYFPSEPYTDSHL